MTILEHFETDALNLENEDMLNLPPVRCAFRSVSFVAHRTENLEGKAMLDAGYGAQFDTTLSARLSQFGTKPATNDEILLFDDDGIQFLRVAGPTRISQDRIMIDFDLKTISADESKFYELLDDGHYVVTEAGQRVEIA